MKKKKLPLEPTVALVLIGIILVLCLEGFVRQDMPALASRFPLAVFGVVILTGIAEFFRSLSAAKKRAEKEEKDGGKKEIFQEKLGEKKTTRKNFITVSVMVILYSILMYLIGFIAASIALFVAFFHFFNFKRIVLSGLCAGLCIVAVYYCFIDLMHIQLPVGALIERILYY